MSTIEIKNDLNTNNWHIHKKNLSAEYADICIGFNKKITEKFQNLQFGFEILHNNETVKKAAFPALNVKLQDSDQEFLATKRIEWKPNSEYKLHLWAKNGNQLFETIETITSPIPVQPFASWSWNGIEWEAPIACPDESKDYEWNEQEQIWEEYPDYEIE